MGVDGILDTTPDYNTHRETINFVVEIVEIIEQPVYVIIPAPSSSQIKEFKQSLQGGLPSYAQKVLEALGLEEYASYIPSYLVETDEANFMLPLDPLLTAANENMKGMIQSIEDIKTKCVSPIQRYITYVFIPLLIIAASLGTYFVKTRFAKKRPKVKEVISLLKVKRNSIS
jgi:ribosomal protein L30/L7E